jgi:hypothetical protein
VFYIFATIVPGSAHLPRFASGVVKYADCTDMLVPLASKRPILFLNYFITVHRRSGFIGAPVTRLQISRASPSFLKGCSFNQSRTYGKEHVSKIGRVPVLDSYGTSPSPYFSLNHICLILSNAISSFRAFRSYSKDRAALLRLYGSYLITVSISSSSHNSHVKLSSFHLRF